MYLLACRGMSWATPGQVAVNTQTEGTPLWVSIPSCVMGSLRVIESVMTMHGVGTGVLVRVGVRVGVRVSSR